LRDILKTFALLEIDFAAFNAYSISVYDSVVSDYRKKGLKGGNRQGKKWDSIM